MNVHTTTFAFVGTMLLGTAAQAGGPLTYPLESQPMPIPSPVVTAPRWDVTLGAGVTYKPDYEGSDEMEASPFPYVSLRYGRVSVGPDSLGVEAWKNDRASFGIALGYGGGRDPEDIDSGALDGLEKIDDTAIFEATFDYGLGPADLFVGLEKYLGESDGTSLTFGVRREADVSDRLTLSASASATVSDDDYMEHYFGVSPAQSAASGYGAYDAGAGLRRVDVAFGATYGLSDRWMLRGEVGVGKLLGDAKDSPIVLDDVQPKAMLAVGMRF